MTDELTLSDLLAGKVPARNAGLYDLLVITTAGGEGAPQRRLPCGCWQALILDADALERWITYRACPEHKT